MFDRGLTHDAAVWLSLAGLSFGAVSGCAPKSQSDPDLPQSTALCDKEVHAWSSARSAEFSPFYNRLRAVDEQLAVYLPGAAGSVFSNWGANHPKEQQQLMNTLYGSQRDILAAIKNPSFKALTTELMLLNAQLEKVRGIVGQDRNLNGRNNAATSDYGLVREARGYIQAFAVQLE